MAKTEHPVTNHLSRPPVTMASSSGPIGHRNSVTSWSELMKSSLFRTLGLLGLVSLAVVAGAADPYETYIKTSRDFEPVKQDRDWLVKAYPSWLFMPWTYQWTIGFNDASGKWSTATGYNGSFIDRGDLATPTSSTGRLQWIEQFKLPFYMDHVAGKGILHLYDGDKVKPHLDELHSTGMRPFPLNDQTRALLEKQIRQNISGVLQSPQRAAYALDDEPSWGHFVHPTMWRINDDPDAFQNWLNEIYGPDDAPKRTSWATYQNAWENLRDWSIADFDVSELMDQWTFNDSQWANELGELVEYTNTIDPDTPVGLVGGQMPSAFGGFDYAKLMRKIQFIESYNLGSSQAIIRSFNPQHAVPAVTTLFHQSVDDTIWQCWYYLAHGNKGHIGWVEGWFDGETPKPWHEEIAPALRESGQKIGPKMTNASWQHDGVAIYYSHPSIQMGWILDAQAHRNTWINRNADESLSSIVHVRRAWENMLRDSGIQYNFINYVDVIQNGISDEYRVLILPSCYCLSNAEADAITQFCNRGGTVIADYMPGLWDQHGRGRTDGGVLDELFGVRHDPAMKASDVFSEQLWTETDQDANYGWKTYEELLTNQTDCIMDPSGFHRAVRSMPVMNNHKVGTGNAVLMNLSPQWYAAYRARGPEAAKKRQTFMQPVRDAGVGPWVRLQGDVDALHGYEITYWNLPHDDETPRTILYVCLNPETRGTSLGGGNSVGLKTDTVPVTVRFKMPLKNVIDERMGQALPDGQTFSMKWVMNEAIVLSFDMP